MLTQDLEAEYHASIIAEHRIAKWQSYSDQLTIMINRLKPITMQLIHVKNQEEYNVVVKSLEHTKGFKPYRENPLIKGDRYVSVEDRFLAYFLDDAKATEKGIEIIPFDQFIKEAI